MTTIKELEKTVDGLAQTVQGLAQVVEDLKPKEAVKPVQATSEDDKILFQELGGPSEPVPAEYRGAVDSVLNKSFGIHVKSELGNFTFTILVPKQYSPLSPEQWAMLHFDKRTKVITHAEGINGVKLWAEKVFNSFNPSVQGQIVADRTSSL